MRDRVELTRYALRAGSSAGSSTPSPGACRSSAGLVVEPAAALDAKAAPVDVLAQQLARTLGEPGTHRGVVLLDVEHDIQADTVHEAKWRDPRLGEDPPHVVDVL